MDAHDIDFRVLKHARILTVMSANPHLQTTHPVTPEERMRLSIKSSVASGATALGIDIWKLLDDFLSRTNNMQIWKNKFVIIQQHITLKR